MRSSSIAILLSAAALGGAALLLACGSDSGVTVVDDADAGKASPATTTTSSTTGKNPDGGTGTAESDASATKDSGPVEVPAPPEFPAGDIEVPPGTCTAIPNESALIVLAGDGTDASVAKGGALADGTYLLVSAKAAIPQELVDGAFGDAKPTVQATLNVAGADVEFVTDGTFGDTGYHGELKANVAAQGKALVGAASCPDARAVNLPYTAKADGTFITWLAYAYMGFNIKVEVTLAKKPAE